jgi:hypothetical protein
MPQASPTESSARKLLHIFKPGKWTTMAGESIEFSQADLVATARAYDPSVAKAPLVIGHPAIDDPAMGWTQSLSANQRGLFATPAKVDPTFAESVRAGAYGTVSAKFYRPTDANNPVPGVWYLRHVGFLGAANPAVKGLDDPEFSAADDGCVCFQEGVAFSEWDDVQNAGLWRNLREWFIGKFGQDEADKVIPSYQVQSLELGAQDELRVAAENASPAAFSEHQPQESTVTEAEAALLRTQNAAHAQRIADLEAAQRVTQTAAAHAANVAFCEGLAADGRLLPAWQGIAVATLDHLATQSTPVEFGEGDAKAPLIDGLRTLLTALPKQVEFGETATNNNAAAGALAAVEFAAPDGFEVDEATLATHNKALAHQKANGGTYIDAVNAVT